MSDSLLNGLLKKKAELLGNVERLEKELETLKVDIENINKVILIFDPTHKLKPIRSKRFNQGFFKGGEFRDLLLEILDEDFLSTDEILRQIQEIKSFQFSKNTTPQSLRTSVLSALHYHADKGLLIRKNLGKKDYRWRLSSAEEMLERF